MESLFLEFLRRYAITLTIRAPQEGYPLPNLVLDIPAALGVLAGDDYFYAGVQALNLTEEHFSYNPLGLSYINDSVIFTDTLLLSEQVQQLVQVRDINTSILVWLFSDAVGSKIYIPVRDDYYHLVVKYLPHFNWWGGTGHGAAYPKQEYFLRGSLEQWLEVYELVVNEISHPFAKGLYLTGYAALQGDGVINYEYVDLDGYYDEPGLYYLSSLRPSGVDFPLGRPKSGDLVKDLCVGDLGWYPEKGSEDWVGKYTGYRTTLSYHPLVTYYLYEREDKSVFLVEGRPHRDAWLWVMNALGWSGLILEVETSSDWVGQVDYSCGVSLLLEDASLIPVSYDYPFSQDVIGDCVNLDDVFILKGGRRVLKFIDDIFPVADLLLFSDMN